MRQTSSASLASLATISLLAAVPLATNGCNGNNGIPSPTDICCTDFKPGADMTQSKFVADAQVNGQFVAFAQASGDITALVSTSVSDVSQACMRIATDLGDDPKSPGAQGKSGTELLKFWCGEAVARITGALGASGSAALQVSFDPPKCSASVQAQASCQASCDATAACDIRQTPPKCTGGTLEIDCKGSCTIEGQAPSIDCTGTCQEQCSGSCQGSATVGVDCVGKCDGTCVAKANVGDGQGPNHADGSCQGTCKGTCALKAGATVSCGGTCSGGCTGACKASPGQASAKCSGKCDSDYQPLSCEGGKLEGGCTVDAKCQGNCNASASAKAECTPARVSVIAQADASSQLGVLAASLEANLPALLGVAVARGQAFLDVIGPIGQGGAELSAKVDVKGAACLFAAGGAVVQAAVDFGVALDQSRTVVAAVTP